MHGNDILFHAVGFRWPGTDNALLADIEVHFAAGWSGIVGANGSGKTTMLRLATGDLEPTSGHVQRGDGALYCAQRTDDAPEDLPSLLQDTAPEAWELRGRLGIESDWNARWATLSHGERKRAQIGVALWHKPAALAIDEPTNHLDRSARQMLLQALRAYRGVGLLVSHDRELLDELCLQCLFVEPPDVAARAGGYTQVVEQRQVERESAVHARQTATRQLRRIEREVHRRRQEASRSHAKRSKKGLGKGDNDKRFQRNLARATGKDGQDGRLLNQLSGRAQRARETRHEIRVSKDHDLGIWVAGTRSHRDRLIEYEAGRLPVGGGRFLDHPALAMQPQDRVAVTGPNGAGKSTLLRALLAEGLRVDDKNLVYVPQEIGRQDAQKILQSVRQLPSDQLGRMMAVVSCLNSRPGRLLESAQPSPGEVRKLLLAAGIAGQPHLIVMDEPTNHMDVPSIECLESALRDCPCGLLLVSHDERFLGALTTTRWEVAWTGEPGSDATVAVQTRSY